MKAIKWKSLIITCLICLVPILLGLVLWNKLPDSIAIHFDINNNPDNFASKEVAVIFLPVLMALLQVVCCLLTDLNAYHKGARVRFEIVTKLIIPIMTCILQCGMLLYSLGYKIDMRMFAIVIVGIIFLFIGNYLPKLDYVKDAKVDTSAARKINRFIGIETVIMGVLALITVFLPPVSTLVWIFCLIPYSIIGVIYGIIVGRKK